MMKRWMQRVKLSKKNDYDPGVIIGNENYKIARNAGQSVKDDTVPQGVRYEVIYAGRHRQPSAKAGNQHRS